MKAVHIGVAILASVLWGGAFIAIKIGLESFTPSQLTALRFLIACLPVFVLPRPPISWWHLVLIGLTLFTGQFLLLFFGYVHGMSPGVASVMMQLQALFTVLIAAVALREIPTRRQTIAIVVAFAGLAVVGFTVGGDLSLSGVLLTTSAALSWAIGNVLVKATRANAPILPMMAWLSLVPPLPALAASMYFDDPPFIAALVAASWRSIAAAIYLGVLATTLAYAMWGELLRRYSAAHVVPFALLAPCVGAGASAIVFGERFGPVRIAGMALILAGVAIGSLRMPGRDKLG